MSMQTPNLQNGYEQIKELFRGSHQKEAKGRDKSETSNERDGKAHYQDPNIRKYKSPPQKQDISELSLEIMEGLNKAKIKVQEQRIISSLEDMLKKQNQMQIEQCRQMQDLLRLEIINLEEMEKKQTVINIEHQILSIKQEIIKCENKIQQILDGDSSETRRNYPQSQYPQSQIKQNETSAVSLQSNQQPRYLIQQNYDYYERDCLKVSNMKKYSDYIRQAQDNERNYFRVNSFKSLDEKGENLYKCKSKKPNNQRYLLQNNYSQLQQKQAKSHINGAMPQTRSKNKCKIITEVQNVSTNTHSRTGSTLSLKGLHTGQRLINQKKKCLMKRKACAQQQLQMTLNYFGKKIRIMNTQIDTLKKQIHIIDEIIYKRNMDYASNKRNVTPTRNKNEERSIQQKIKQYRTKTLSHRRQSSNLFVAARSKQKKLIYQISRKKEVSTISHCLSERRITSQISNIKNLEGGENRKQCKLIERSRIIEQNEWCEYYEKKQKSPAKRGVYKPKPTYYK